MERSTLLLCFFSLSSIFMTPMAFDTLSAAESIKDGQTIVSAGGTFELGFFTPGDSEYRYLGIWYKKISTGTVVWVANREVPLTNSSGVLKFNARGLLVLVDRENLTIWSSKAPRVVQNPVAQLLGSRNFVIRENSDHDTGSFLWQSFDHPDNTLLPGMKMGRLAEGLDVRLSSWKSTNDPSRGNADYQIDSSGLQMVTTQKTVFRCRSGPWIGISFSGIPSRPNKIYTYSFVHNEKEIYYTYDLVNTSVFSRLVLYQNGILHRYTWIDRTKAWNLYLAAPSDDCANYALCGAYGSCDIRNLPVCSCLNGFVPKFKSDWDRADWSEGCVRRTPLVCEKGDGFRMFSHVKLPDMKNFSMNGSMTLEECRVMCLTNCSCMAYANSDIRGSGSGCYLWFGALLDMRQYKEDMGQDLYVRIASSELAIENQASSNNKKEAAITAISVSLTGLILLVLGVCLFIRKRKRKKKQNTLANWEISVEENYSVNNQEENIELPHFDFVFISKATNNFSLSNLIGKGGFGPVYKGILRGQEVAVKKLSEDSRQGTLEFMNEVKFIAKLQHRNLVKLLGYCIHLEEKMLIYEFMPNKSLDFYIFDEKRGKLLDWTMKFHIIHSIARGLLYLHQDSRLRIVHRDLKLSNVLLDNEMNPKISDFGMARSFEANETAANTNRVVGTYGYMSPEYAIDGLFSIKSDVFSFGVMVLEIISGRRNRGFSHPEHQLNLLGHAWTLFKEGRFRELINGLIVESCNLPEMLRSAHVALLCVQHCPEDRPSMSSVVLMLSGEGALPEPKEPGFFTERKMVETEHNSCSLNDVTITTIEVR